MRVTSRGRVTIPKAIRDRFGLLPGDHVDFVVDGKDIYLVKVIEARGENPRSSFKRSVRHGMTTDEILTMTRDASWSGSSA